MLPVPLILTGWAACAVFMFLLWLWEVRTRDATIVDIGWATGIAMLCVLYPALGNLGTRGWLVGAVGAAWALRLAAYLLHHRVLGRPGEDGRYARMRAAMGSRAHAGFLVFFQVQASWSVLFSLPMLAAMLSPTPVGTRWDVVGLLVWLAAVVGETVSDTQLARFRANPANKGRTCRDGLWLYSRHPNYFFEWLHWFAYVALAVGSPWWWVTLAAPVVMLVFLFRLTGIPHTERQALSTRGEDYRRYQQTTSIFIPWFPRKEATS